MGDKNAMVLTGETRSPSAGRKWKVETLSVVPLGAWPLLAAAERQWLSELGSGPELILVQKLVRLFSSLSI